MKSGHDHGGVEVLRGRKVVVTGGAGFIGSHTIDRLIDCGCREIIAVDDMVRGRPENLDAARARGTVKLINGDIRDRALMHELLTGTDTVFHMAALRITQCAAEPRRAMEVMVDATFDLFENCVALRVRKVVMASSASVYGMAETFPTREDHHPYGNRTLYGVAKIFGEGLARAFNEMHQLDYVSLRYFNAYGPRMDIHGRYTEVLIRWMERIEAGQPPVIFGDGRQTMDMVHGCDIARANILAAEAAATDVTLNIGSGSETSLRDLAGTADGGNGSAWAAPRARAGTDRQSGGEAAGRYPCRPCRDRLRGADSPASGHRRSGDLVAA